MKLPELKQVPQAANATMWMASPTTPQKQGGPARSTTVNQEILRYIEIFFGSLCGFLVLLSLVHMWKIEARWHRPLLICLFFGINWGLFYAIRRSSRPRRLVLLQTLLGWLLCPVVYLWAGEGEILLWPAYVVMALSGSILWGLIFPRPLWARIVLLGYLLNMVIATVLGVDDPDWRELALRAGILGIIGLMLIQLTEILSLSLSRVYERSLQHRKAKEDLQEITRLKTEFFANISHEFRTPITLTLSPLEAVLKGRYGQTLAELAPQLDLMIRNQQRLLGLINQILDISKAEAGALELKAALIPDLNRFIQERVEQFRPTAQERGLELRVLFDPLVKGVEIYIDPEKFDKILFNLLSNALKFTQKGSIKVHTEIRGDRFVMEVSDSGIGIKETEIPFIFDRFRQADGSSTREFAGTGLGLALVQELSKLHGGQVTVHSRYGHGTRFQVEIPLGKSHLSPESIVDFADAVGGSVTMSSPKAIQAAPVDPARYAELNAESERLHDPDKPTVLYAEDNPDLMYFMRDLLVDTYNVYVAPNGQEGLAQAKLRLPDLIFSDMMMPIMDGAEFCRKVHEDNELKAVPFVLLTARSMLESKIEGLEGGADDYLTKPFSEAELLARAKNLVNLHRQQVKLKRELEAARAIQFSLLPQVPQHFEGCEVDFLYQPSEDLSGDFCDVLRQGSWIYFYLADVTSHGTASAQITYLVKEIFAQSISRQGSIGDAPLADLMVEAQKQYAAHGLQYDVAIQVARYHPATRTLEIVRGNAPSPLQVGASSQSIRVPPSPALSSRNSSEPGTFATKSVQLQPGDSVFFFTDGCYEFSAGEREFGLKHLHELLGSMKAENWKSMVMEKLVEARGGREFPDDLTLLRLKIANR